ncbi:unnamed protein product, partial [Ectocarpus sp. 8 AP-2014]
FATAVYSNCARSPTTHSTMFRSLFGTTVAGEYGDTGTTGGRPGNPSGQEQAARKGTPNKTAPGGGSSSAQQDAGGFFQLEPTHASAEESLFDDLEVKPPAVEPKPSPMKPPADSESAAGVFSAFQFMAEPAAPSDKAVPIGGSPPSAGGGGPGMSAFSFLTDESPAAGNSVEAQDETVSIPGDAAGKTTPSSFSFLSEGGGRGPAAGSSVAAEAVSSVVSSSSPLAATGNAVLPASSDGKAAAEVGGAAEQTPGDVDQQPAGSSGLASEVSSPSASSSTTARAGGLAATATATAAQEGADKKPAADDVPSWKPSASVVRKKRAVRRVGYAREETLASSSMAPPVPRSPTAGRQAGSDNASTEAAGDQTSGSTPSATAGGGLSRGGGGDYEAPSVPIPSRKASTSPMTAGREAMDDSMVAEAAAMAALAASMAPSEIQGAMAKGDLKQGSSHGTASSSTSSAAGGGAAAAAAAAAASLSNPHPTAMKKNHGFMTKFKGLLSQSSSSKSDSSPLSPLAAARKSATNPTVATTPRSSPKDAAAAAAAAKAGQDHPPSRSERGGADPDSAAGGGSSVVCPAFSGGEENGAVQ